MRIYSRKKTVDICGGRERAEVMGGSGREREEKNKSAEVAVSLSRSVSRCRLESRSHYMHV